jgi:hypothetical protein
MTGDSMGRTLPLELGEEPGDALPPLACRQMLTDAAECLTLASQRMAGRDYAGALDLVSGAQRRMDSARAIVEKLTEAAP